MEAEMHALIQQMSEIAGAFRSLHDAIEMRQAQAEQMHEDVRSELRILRQDQRELEERMHCITYVMQHDVTALRCGAAEHRRSIDSLVDAVENLRRPIADIVLLKSRLAGLIVALGFIGSAVLWLAEPVYRWIVDAKLLRHLGPS